jgi:hypothetical protein
VAVTGQLVLEFDYQETQPMLASEPSTVNLKSPYAQVEWQAIVAALRAERERRQKRGLPFPAADQMVVVNGVLLPLRTPPP